MTVELLEILFKLSTKQGDKGNELAAAPNQSLGKYISETLVSLSSLMDNLFDDISAADNQLEVVDYRCIFIHNANLVDTLHGVTAWISQLPSSVTVKIGVDPTAASLIDSASAQAVSIADEHTAPVGVTFSTAVDSGHAVSLGDIGPNRCRALWIERTATNTAAIPLDSASIRVEGT